MHLSTSQLQLGACGAPLIYYSFEIRFQDREDQAIAMCALRHFNFLVGTTTINDLTSTCKYTRMKN